MVGAGDVVDVADVVGTRDAVGLAVQDGGGSIAVNVALQKPQREQAEVGLVAEVDQTRAGVGFIAVSRSLFVRRGLLIAVNAAAQQLLVF